MIDRSLQRMQAQRASLAKRVEHKAFQRVGVEAEAPAKPTFPPVVKVAPKQNNIGNVVPQLPEPLHWKNTDQPVGRRERNNGEYNYSNCDWRN
jgi:hypothetical protein